MSAGDIEAIQELPAGVRRQFAIALGQVLDESYLLLVQTHLYHRNVRGPMFADLHKLLEAQYDQLFRSVDELAERVRRLGVPVPGDLSAFSSAIRIPANMSSDEAMVVDLVSRHEEITRKLRILVDDAEDTPACVSRGLNDMLGFHERASWMLRSIITVWPNRPGSGNGSGRLRAVSR
jgi:starvation-inducible DNA-binding protein